MKPERFRSQTRLLQTTRPDGHQAQALDTKNVYEYVTGTGWIQLVLASGVPGAPVLVSPTSRTQVVDGDTSQLLPPIDPDVVEPGQIFALDENSIPQFVTRDSAGLNVAVDFSDGATHDVVSLPIAGGALGDSGFLKLTLYATTISGSARTVTFNTFGIDATSESLAGSANEYDIIYEMQAMKPPSPGTGLVLSFRITPSRYATAAATSTVINETMFFGSTATDTSVDWTLTTTVTGSSTFTTAVVRAALAEYGLIG